MSDLRRPRTSWLAAGVLLAILSVGFTTERSGGAGGDSAGPVLSSWMRQGTGATQVGDTVYYNWNATDADSGVYFARFAFYTPIDGHLETRDFDGSPASVAINDTMANGLYRLRYVEVVDNAGISTHYWRDGTVTVYPPGASGPTSHAFDLSQGDFTVGTGVPPEPTPTPTPTPSPSPTPTPTPTPDPTPVERQITLNLSGHLRVRGVIHSEASVCETGPVKIQRKRTRGWRSVARLSLNSHGSFGRNIEDKAGRYRAVLGVTEACQRAVSLLRRHKH